MSASAIPRRSLATTSSSRSAAIPSSRGTPPASRTSARIPGPFASGIPAGPRSVPAALTSSPVARTATTGRRRTTTSASPEPDASATTAGVTVTPGSTTVAPASTSLPRARMALPTSTGSWTRHAAGNGPAASRPRGPGLPVASSGVVISTGTTASAPAGIGAPVAIRIAVSGITRASGAEPARDSPTTVSRTGRPSDAAATSAARTA